MIKSLFLIWLFIFLPTVILAGSIAEISAEALYAEFEGNEIAAETRYKGKEVIISGRIIDVKKNIAGQPIVNLDAGLVKFISCRFPNDKMNLLIGLKKGEIGKFSCTVDSKMLTTINLFNCSIR